MRRLSFIILIGLIAWLGLAQFRAVRTPPKLNLPAQQAVKTLHPIVGVHTRLSGLDEATIERNLVQVREMGATTIVDLFPWAFIQPRSAYAYDWYGADLVIEHAQRQGLQVIARLDFIPAWARPTNTNDRYLDPEHYADYANFVAAFAQRYAPKGVQVLQILNEPNLRFEWGDRAPDPLAYAELLKVVYPKVKAVAPEVLITVAGLSPGGPTGAIEPNTLSVNDLQYFDVLLTEKAPFDAVAVHAYGGKAPADQEPAADLVNFRRVEVYHQRLVAAGRDLPIYITEGGWNDHPRWTGAVNPPERVRYTLQAYAWAEQQPWLKAVCLWQFSLPTPAYNYVDNYTFVQPDGTPKAIYYAIQAWTQGR